MRTVLALFINDFVAIPTEQIVTGIRIHLCGLFQSMACLEVFLTPGHQSLLLMQMDNQEHSHSKVEREMGNMCVHVFEEVYETVH